MQIIRYASDSGAQVALQDGEAIRPLPVPSLADLLSLPADQLRAVVDATAQAPPDARASAGQVRLLPPADGLTEVWGAGVTYERSSAARQEESQVADVYARVYEAERPELFLKCPAWRACGPGEPIGIRPDSSIDVPEAELAVVCTARGEIVGATICNDVSSRSIEGENPLYLPQAKTYTGSCALGPGIVPAWLLPPLDSLAITVTVSRGGERAWHGQTSTAQLHRRLTDLVGYLFRHAAFPQGVILSTGTGVVPDLDFSLLLEDQVLIDIDGIGRLANVVRPATEEWFGWLTPAPDRRPPGPR